MANNATTDAIVNQYIGYATSIAREWVAKVPATIDPADIHSAALEGLSAAANQFDSEHGAAFTTYARSFIIGRIKSLLRKLDTLTRGERVIANEITDAATALEQMLSRYPTPAEIAKHLGIDTAKVVEIKSTATRRVPVSIEESNLEFVAIGDLYLPEESALVAEQNQHIRLAVDSLPDSMREVIDMIYFDGLGVNEVAAKLGITHEAVSQRHMKGRELLSNALSEFAGRDSDIDADRVSMKQRNCYLDSYRAATADPSAMLRSIEFAA